MKLTRLIPVLILALPLGAAALAHAGPVPVAVYSFQTKGDVAAFQKQSGKRCAKKWAKQKQMSITVGKKTTTCAFATSVVGESQISAQANTAGRISKKLIKKAFVGVGARSSTSAGYELRVRPAALTWQLFRDPAGAPRPALLQAGKGKFVRKGRKPVSLSLRAFDYGSTTSTFVKAMVNGKPVFSFTDTGAGRPDGRSSVVTAGVKGSGPGTGVVGIFDNVAIKVPNPF